MKASWLSFFLSFFLVALLLPFFEETREEPIELETGEIIGKDNGFLENAMSLHVCPLRRDTPAIHSENRRCHISSWKTKKERTKEGINEERSTRKRDFQKKAAKNREIGTRGENENVTMKERGLTPDLSSCFILSSFLSFIHSVVSFVMSTYWCFDVFVWLFQWCVWASHSVDLLSIQIEQVAPLEDTLEGGLNELAAESLIQTSTLKKGRKQQKKNKSKSEIHVEKKQKEGKTFFHFLSSLIYIYLLTCTRT